MLLGYLCGLPVCVCLIIFCMFVESFFMSDFLIRTHDERVSVSFAFRILSFLKCANIFEKCVYIFYKSQNYQDRRSS